MGWKAGTMRQDFPDFGGMARIVSEHGRRAGGVLVILPFHNKYDFLDAHLDLLGKQTYRKFDLLIVGSSGSDEKRIEGFVREKKPDFAVLIAKRFEDNGAAGGFYTGERFALENGYDCMVLAEEDALPVDARVMEKLVGERAKGTGFAASVCQFGINGTVVFDSHGGHMYTMVSRDAIQKAGLHYIPMYLGAEDGDMMLRLPKPVIVDARVTHPAWLSVFANFERNVGYRVNKIIFICESEKLSYLYTFGALLPGHILFGTGLTRSAAFHIISCVLRMKYGKEAVFNGGKAEVVAGRAFDGAVTPVELGNVAAPKLALNQGGIPGRIARFAGFVFRKNIVFYPVKNYELLLGMMLSRETWIATPSGYYILAENRNPLLHPLKILSFALLSPLMLVLGVLIWPTLVLRKPDTRIVPSGIAGG
jgi:hypothetical protein